MLIYLFWLLFRAIAASHLGNGKTENLKISDVEDFVTAAECSVDGFRSKESLSDFFIIHLNIILSCTHDNIRKFQRKLKKKQVYFSI